MSHLVSIDMENVTDLDALEKAAPEFGMELVRDVHTYRWWGHSVGDYPLPKGFKESDLGKCDHVLRVKGNSGAYEIGITKAKNGQPGYQLLYDFYGSAGRAVQNCVGSDSSNLKRFYSKEYGINHWKKKGFRVTTKTREDGTIVGEAVRMRRG